MFILPSLSARSAAALRATQLAARRALIIAHYTSSYPRYRASTDRVETRLLERGLTCCICWVSGSEGYSFNAGLSETNGYDGEIGLVYIKNTPLHVTTPP